MWDQTTIQSLKWNLGLLWWERSNLWQRSTWLALDNTLRYFPNFRKKIQKKKPDKNLSFDGIRRQASQILALQRTWPLSHVRSEEHFRALIYPATISSPGSFWISGMVSHDLASIQLTRSQNDPGLKIDSVRESPFLRQKISFDPWIKKMKEGKDRRRWTEIYIRNSRCFFQLTEAHSTHQLTVCSTYREV